MLTITIGNVSTTDVLAASSLPAPFQLQGDIAASGSTAYVIQVHDLDKVEDNHSGFTAGDMLQQMRQANLITVAIADAGDDQDNGSVFDEAVATAA
jgi:phosphatidylethanolamine-binding protein (PEBP) family uncharacterized protein